MRATELLFVLTNISDKALRNSIKFDEAACSKYCPADNNSFLSRMKMRKTFLLAKHWADFQFFRIIRSFRFLFAPFFYSFSNCSVFDNNEIYGHIDWSLCYLFIFCVAETAKNIIKKTTSECSIRSHANSLFAPTY